MKLFPRFYKSISVLCLIWLTSTVPVYAQHPDRLQRTADALERNHQYREALDLYLKIFQKNTHNMSVVAGIKNCYIGLQEYPALIGFLEQITAGSAPVSSLFIDLGEAYFLNNEPDRARETWRRYLENNRQDPTAFRLVAMAMIRLRLFDDAIQTYRQAIATLKNQETLYVDIANLYMAQLDYTQATDHYLAYYRYQPKQVAFVKRQLLFISDKSTDIQPVVDGLNRFLQNNPQDRPIREILGGLYLKNKDYEQAFRVYQFLDQDEKSGRYIQQYALETFQNKAFPFAITGYEYYLEKYPQSPQRLQVQYELARTCAAMASGDPGSSGEKMDRATLIYNQIITVNEKSDLAARSMIDLGDIYYEYYYDMDQALAYFKLFLKSHSRNKQKDDVFLRIGDAYLTKNQTEEALRSYQQATGGNVQNKAWFKMAETHYFTARFSEAQKIYSRLISQIPSDDPMINDLLARRILLKEAASDSLTLARFSHADLLRFQKRMGQAAEEYAELSRNGTRLRSQAAIIAGELYLALDKADLAYSVLTGLHNDIPESGVADQILMLLARSEEKRGHMDAALSFYNEIMVRYPTSLHVQKAREKARILTEKMKQEQI